MHVNLRMLAVFLLTPALSPAAHLCPTAGRAFETYAASVEARLERQHAQAGSYLAVLDPELAGHADAERELSTGAIYVEPVGGGSWPVAGGLLHHWRAAALVPGATAGQMLELLKDYDHLARYYAPEVVSSRALARDGDSATLAMRFKKQQIVTVVLDAEFESRSALVDPRRGWSRSRSIHLWQVDHAGTPQERRRKEGNDDGFLWRLNSYWSFRETAQGLFIECEAVSLTRDVPAGLGWLIRPIIATLPRASLESTLTSTRNALEANVTREKQR